MQAGQRILPALVATFILLLLGTGCDHRSNPVASDRESVEGLARISRRSLPKIDVLSKPAIREVKTQEAESKVIYPTLKAEIKARFRYKTYGGRDTEYDATLTFEKGSVSEPITVTLSYDTLTGGLLIGPTALRLLKPALLDLRIRNVDPFASNVAVYFVSPNNSGSFDIQYAEEMIVDAPGGNVEMKKALMHEGGTFLFGTNIELLTVPALGQILKSETAIMMVPPDKSTRLEASLEYLSTEGIKVQLSAALDVPIGGVAGPVTISMQFNAATGAIEFLPEGLQFLQPAMLDVTTKNINAFRDTAIEFVYLNPSGTLEPQVCRTLVANPTKGEIRMEDAEVHHFSAYAFGRRF